MATVIRMMTEGTSTEHWTQETEGLITKWRDEALTTGDAHDKAGKRCKSRHTFWGLPAALIPVIFAPIAAAVDRDQLWWFKYAEAATLLFSGACSVMINFFSYSAKAEQHFAYAARYADLITDIETELAKAAAHRQPVSVFLVRAQMMLDALNRGGPDL